MTPTEREESQGETKMVKILFIADIIGEPGRKTVNKILNELKKKENIEFTIANAENAAGGFGLTKNVAEEIINSGVEVLTLGNHVWDRKEIKDIIDDQRILRPANYPPFTPGKGYNFYFSNQKTEISVVNLMGRVYMPDLDCPFRCMDTLIPEIKKETNLIIVDFHAEITSEKQALGWYLDGKVSAVIGTHTHVQTADERILPEGTAYITDCGMTGPRDSVIGIKKEIILKKYLTQIPLRFEVAAKDLIFSAVIIDLDEKSGKATNIKRLQIPAGDM
jgi:hypothetical protein